MQTLSEASATLAQKMYAESGEGAAGEAAADDDLGDAVDAEFEEVKDDKNS